MKPLTVLLDICPLFSGIPKQVFGQVLRELKAECKTYPASHFLLHAGAPAKEIGIVLEGRVQVIQEDFSGNRIILAELAPGDLFAEAFVCSSGREAVLPVSVFAVSKSSAVWINWRRLIQPGFENAPWRPVLIGNMLSVLADKNQLLNRRIRHLTKRTTREKLLSFFGEQATICGSLEFTIPFSRQELADYLCVERSAMSAVLSSLQKERVLEAVSRRCFRFLTAPDGQMQP